MRVPVLDYALIKPKKIEGITHELTRAGHKAFKT